MTKNETRATVEKIALELGFSVPTRSKRNAASLVSLYFNGSKTGSNSMTFCVGTEPALTDSVRTALWLAEGLRLVAALETAGLPVDRTSCGTDLDGRTFAVKFEV